MVTCDKHYCFRPVKGQKAQEIVDRLNELIKDCYHLG